MAMGVRRNHGHIFISLRVFSLMTHERRSGKKEEEIVYMKISLCVIFREAKEIEQKLSALIKN